MIRLLLTWFQIPFFAAFVLSTTQAAEPELRPAPYQPLPVGTVLDYGTWKCSVEQGAEFEHVCRGPGGDLATFFGKFVPVGTLAESGYGSGLNEIWCEGRPASNVFAIALENVLLGDAARIAIRSLWPLEVGKEISFDRKFGVEGRKAKSKIRVVGTKTVAIAGVDRRVFVVRGRTERLRCPFGTTQGFNEVWWYDPEIATVVHYEIGWVNSASTGLDFEYSLVRATFPKGPLAGRGSADRRSQFAARRSSTPVQPAQPPETREPRSTKRAVRASASAPQRTVKPRPPPTVTQDNTPPVITVAERLATSGKTVEVIGSVRDASQIAEVAIDGRQIAVAADGGFRVRRVVPPGKSVLRLSALDEWGNEAAQEITVTRRRTAARTQVRRRVKPDLFAGLDFGAYQAIVIGNNAYKHFPDLKSAVRDAEAVAALLQREYGFRIELLRNASREDLIGALARKRQELTGRDNLLIYFAGHGVLDKDTNEGYWLPVEAKPDNPANWVSNADITTMLRAIPAKHIMVVADSCYSGTLVRGISVRRRPVAQRAGWIRGLLGKRARIALVSGGLEPVVDGGGGGNSVFARAFLRALRANRSVIEGNRLFDAIRRPVVLNANQTPRYSDIRLAGHDGGDFIFVRR